MFKLEGKVPIHPPWSLGRIFLDVRCLWPARQESLSWKINCWFIVSIMYIDNVNIYYRNRLPKIQDQVTSELLFSQDYDLC